MRSIDSLPVMQAAVFNVGCGPFVAFVLSVIVAGIIAYAADWLVKYIPMKEPLKAIALYAIYIFALGYVILLAADFLFGINLFGVRPMPVCG